MTYSCSFMPGVCAVTTRFCVMDGSPLGLSSRQGSSGTEMGLAFQVDEEDQAVHSCCCAATACIAWELLAAFRCASAQEGSIRYEAIWHMLGPQW